MIKNVFIDLDDTLLDFQKAEAVAIRKTLSEAGVEPTEETISLYSKINDSQWKLLEKGEATREQVLTERFRILFEELEVDISIEETRLRYEHLLGVGHFFVDGAPELLENLYGKYGLYLASNGTAVVQDSRIASAGISKYFKEIFISQRVGFDKPQAGYFEYCFNAIPDYRREETIIIGDSLSSDIMGGSDAGIYTCWFNPKGKARSGGMRIDYEVTSLSEIPDLLESI